MRLMRAVRTPLRYSPVPYRTDKIVRCVEGEKEREMKERDGSPQYKSNEMSRAERHRLECSKKPIPETREKIGLEGRRHTH
jgi:hypothetical protein